MRIVVTDFTRLPHPHFHCVAGMDGARHCYRPTVNYFTKGECQYLSILAGTILEGEFRHLEGAEPPHAENCTRRDVRFAGYIAAADFRALLDRDCAPSVAAGFGAKPQADGRALPLDARPLRSIVTIRAVPDRCRFEPDARGGGLCFSFADGAGQGFEHLPLADLKILEHAARRPDALDHMNLFLHRRPDLLLRVGLVMPPDEPDPAGYRLQVNGVFTFAERTFGIRGFSDRENGAELR